MGERTVKLLRLPSFFRKRQFSSRLNCSLIPPLGPALISGYLRSQGIPVEQDDLNIKLHYDSIYPATAFDAVDIEVFFDGSRILRYTNGEEDRYLDSIMDKAALKATVCQGQILLLSLPDNIENDSNLMFTLAFSRFLKERYNTVNVLGGDNLWLDLLRNKEDGRYIDRIIYGEGEFPSLEILNYLLHKQELEGKHGLSFLEGGRVIHSTVMLRPIKPDFSGLPIEKYKSSQEVLSYPEEIREIMDKFQSSRTLLLPYRFIRGCPFECAFCVSSTQKLTYALPPGTVAAHLDSLQKEYRPAGFFFLNDTINISKLYINRLCEELIRNKVKVLWSDCARADNLDRDTLFKMRQAGCIRLIFGMETASPRLLKYINKKIELEQLSNALKWSDEAGIWTGVEVICGLPHESEEDVASTISFLNFHRQYINRIYLNHFDLRENTPLYNSPGKYGLRSIFEVNQYAGKDFLSYVRFGFDEANGLSWREKEKQIEHSLKAVQDNCARGYRYFTDEHLLFFLYAQFGDKKRISPVYLKILEQG